MKFESDVSTGLLHILFIVVYMVDIVDIVDIVHLFVVHMLVQVEYNMAVVEYMQHDL
jgi:hypothetical protein